MALMQPGPRLRLTEVELCAWLAEAEPGEALEYHRGFLALDRAAGARRLPEAEQAELGRLADRAWWAAEQGLVHLVQRRRRDGYRYLIVARRHGAPASLRALLAEALDPTPGTTIPIPSLVAPGTAPSDRCHAP
jgi:hypothetical protein